MRLPRFVRPAAGGALLGLLGVGYVIIFGWVMLGRSKPFAFEHYPMPAFFGDGYGVIRQLLNGTPEFNLPLRYILVLLCSLGLLKILGTCLTLGSGGSGGIIAPSLFIGSVAGAILGLVLQSLGWRHVQPEVYALVGMGAVLAAVVHAPLASILIVFELTRDEKVILPAMLACVLAAAAARALFRDSIYTLTLRQRGVRLGTMADLTLLRRLAVDQVPLEAAPAVRETDELRHVLELMTVAGEKNFIVLDSSGRYSGIVVAEDVHAALLDPEAIPLLLVSDIARHGIPAVRSTDDLASVLDAFALYDIDHLPVIREGAIGPPSAMIGRAALLRHYQKGLAQRA
jgi:CIC family chloride channel protein